MKNVCTYFLPGRMALKLNPAGIRFSNDYIKTKDVPDYFFPLFDQKIE